MDEAGVQARSGWQPPNAAASRDLRTLPKAHLHLHLVGAMRSSTLTELCAREGRQVPDLASVHGWGRFAAVYDTAAAVLRKPDDLRRIVHEIAEDEADSGARWVEITTNPELYRGRLGRAEAVLEVLLDAGRAAQERTGVGVGWVVAADRTRPDRAIGLATLAARYADHGVVGFGLANDERAESARQFTRAFAIARTGGLRSVPHAGELTGPADVEDALTHLRAERIGHGVQAVRDPRVLDAVATAGAFLEVCPTSNVALGVVASIAAHPLKELLDAGVRCTLNADDPLLFRTTILDEYERVRTHLGLDDPTLAGLAGAAVDASGAPDEMKERMLEDIQDWFSGPADRRIVSTPDSRRSAEDL